MARDVAKVLLATALFGLVHSVLAGAWAQRQAVELFGERAVNGLYRPAYVALSAALTGLLVWYMWRLPGRELYHARGAAAWAMRAGQAAGADDATAGIHHDGNGIAVPGEDDQGLIGARGPMRPDAGKADRPHPQHCQEQGRQQRAPAGRLSFHGSIPPLLRRLSRDRLAVDGKRLLNSRNQGFMK